MQLRIRIAVEGEVESSKIRGILCAFDILSTIGVIRYGKGARRRVEMNQG
jgi:hypothetical protein